MHLIKVLYTTSIVFSRGHALQLKADTVHVLEGRNPTLNMSALGVNSEEEEYSSEESENGSGSGSSSYESSESESGTETETEDESEEEVEPVLKYKRFARDVVASISQGQGGEKSNVICCMAVHSKVSFGAH